MATVNYSANACPALLVAQKDILKQNSPENLNVPIGLMQALRDPSNIAPFKFTQLGDGDGHLKTVRVSYRPPLTAGEVSDAFSCDAGTAQPYLENLVAMAQHSHLAMRVTEADIRKLCGAASEYVRLGGNNGVTNAQTNEQLRVMQEVYDVVALGFPAMREDVNRKLNDSLVTKIGTWLGGATSKSYVFRNSDGQYAGSAVLNGYATMKQDLRKTTFNGEPIFVGAGIFELSNTALNYGCCNAGGTDFGQMSGRPGFKYYIDDYTPTALANANGLIGIMPGTAQFLFSNKNVGNFAEPIGNRTRGIIADPSVPGLFYDLSIVPNECGEYYDVYLDLDFDLWAAPNNMFKAGDARTGINGVVKVIAGEQSVVPAP